MPKRRRADNPSNFIDFELERLIQKSQSLRSDEPKPDRTRPSGDLVEQQEFEDAFNGVVRARSIQRRNKRNAAQPRPSRQKVTDAQIVAVYTRLERQGIPQHKLCSAAHAWLDKPMTLDKFRVRYSRLGLRTKKRP